MRTDIYSQSLLIIDMAGRVLRLFTPFQVIEIGTKNKYWVSKISWDSEGIPFYQIEKDLICYNRFIIL